MRPLLVGEASNLASGEAFAGRSGLRLAGLLRMSLGDFRDRFECVNLARRWPGREPGKAKGHVFAAAPAAHAARRLRVGGRVVVLAGRRVAAAFGVGGAAFFEAVDLNRGEEACVVIPHPSGIVRFWNDAANVRAASRCLKGVLKLCAAFSARS